MNDLPANWELLSLGELTEATRPICYGVLKPGPYVDGGVPLLRIQDLAGNVVSTTQVHCISKALDMEFERSRLEGGEVLLSIQGTIGRAAIAPDALKGANVSRTLAVIAPDDRLNRRFLFYYFQYLALVGGYDTKGSTRASLNIGTIRRMVIPLPPAADQAEVVAAVEQHLSRLDAAEGSMKAARERIDVLARVSTRQLFDSQAWPWTTLGEIAEIKGGVTKDAKREADPAFVEVPYLRVANVQRGRLELGEVTTIRVQPNRAKALRLAPGDVLLNEGGDRDKLGRGWVWEGQIENCIHQNHVFRARLDEGFDPYFVSTHANTWGQAWFEEHGRQTTNLASINLGTLKRFPVPGTTSG